MLQRQEVSESKSKEVGQKGICLKIPGVNEVNVYLRIKGNILWN